MNLPEMIQKLQSKTLLPEEMPEVADKLNDAIYLSDVCTDILNLPNRMKVCEAIGMGLELRLNNRVGDFLSPR